MKIVRVYAQDVCKAVFFQFAARTYRTAALYHKMKKCACIVANHCNVVGDELSDGDGELAGGEGVVCRGVQRGRGHSILHAAHHVLPVLLTGLGQAQHFLQV